MMKFEQKIFFLIPVKFFSLFLYDFLKNIVTLRHNMWIVYLLYVDHISTIGRKKAS